MQRISFVSQKIVTKTLENYDLSDAEIFFKWNDIVGSQFSEYIFPKKISNVRDKKILYVNVIRYKILEAQYSKNIILEKINTFFGKNIFSEIKFFKIN